MTGGVFGDEPGDPILGRAEEIAMPVRIAVAAGVVAAILIYFWPLQQHDQLNTEDHANFAEVDYAPARVLPEGDPRNRLDHIPAMIACRSALYSAARSLAEQENSLPPRWGSTRLRDMFSGVHPEGECGDAFVSTGQMPPDGCSNVYTYFGYDLALLPGENEMVTYDCDYDHDNGRIVDVRMAKGFLP